MPEQERQQRERERNATGVEPHASSRPSAKDGHLMRCAQGVLARQARRFAWRAASDGQQVAEERKPEQQGDGTFRPLSPSAPERSPAAMLPDEEGLGPGEGQLVEMEEDEYEELLPWPERQKRLQQRADAAALELARFEVLAAPLLLPRSYPTSLLYRTRARRFQSHMTTG